MSPWVICAAIYYNPMLRFIVKQQLADIVITPEREGDMEKLQNPNIEGVWEHGWVNKTGDFTTEWDSIP